jgi:tRNA-dihydrouridine synthase B
MPEKKDDNLLARLLDPDERPVCAAPLAGWTDAPYRAILRRQGARHIWVPFVSTHAVASVKSPNRDAYVREVIEERCHVQIFGNNPSICAKAAKIIEDAGAASIDFNAGCSVRKVHKGGGGSILLKTPELLYENMKAIRDAVEIPVSLKTRIGFYETGDKSGIEACRRAQDMGFKWVTLHGRYAKQGFTGEADWDAIAVLAGELKIPVIGNGDIETPGDAKRMFERTGCAGVMVGRAIMGDPWLIGDCENYLRDKTNRPQRTRADLVEVMLDHQAELLKRFPGQKAVWEFRKHLSRYLRGFAQAAVLRQTLVRLDDPAEVTKLLREFGEGKPPGLISD